jgi:dynein heavy chain
MLISSGIISYLGPYTQKYRHDIVEAWRNLMNFKSVPLSAGYSLVKCLGDPVEIRKW